MKIVKISIIGCLIFVALISGCTEHTDINIHTNVPSDVVVDSIERNNNNITVNLNISTTPRRTAIAKMNYSSVNIASVNIVCIDDDYENRNEYIIYEIFASYDQIEEKRIDNNVLIIPHIFVNQPDLSVQIDYKNINYTKTLECYLHASSVYFNKLVYYDGVLVLNGTRYVFMDWCNLRLTIYPKDMTKPPKLTFNNGNCENWIGNKFVLEDFIKHVMLYELERNDNE